MLNRGTLLLRKLMDCLLVYCCKAMFKCIFSEGIVAKNNRSQSYWDLKIRIKATLEKWLQHLWLLQPVFCFIMRNSTVLEDVKNYNNK